MDQARHSRFVLTGGIGAGKSLVAALLGEHGIPVVSADAAGHTVLEPGGEAEAAVAARWPEVLTEGRIDRGRLGRVVFADPAQLAELEAMTHPAIARLVAVQLEGIAGLAFLEVPLLHLGWGEGWPRVVVFAPAELRRRRLAARGMTADDISARMAAQPSDQEWQEVADFIVDNDSDQEHLRLEVARLLRWIHAQAAAPS